MAHDPIKRHTYTLALLLVALTQKIHPNPVKSAARPVFEVINENDRSDLDIDELTHSNPGLPYGNPLAGNSQRAKQYALSQQAMFNAERVRQHRAQLQRWTKAPQQIDSYMEAYRKSQENHQLALEESQGKPADVPPPETHENAPKAVTDLPHRKSTVKARREVNLKTKDTVQFMDEDAIDSDPDKNRNHRSHGSADINLSEYKSAYIQGSQSYENGVTIKPHGIVGSTTLNLQTPEGTPSSKLYTEAISNNIQYVYPKEDLQRKSYKTTEDAETLASLLKKLPHEQFTHSNALIDAATSSHDDSKTLNRPIDLFFYLKDASPHTFPKNFETAESASERDQKPITEVVDDVENPHAGEKKAYGFENVLTKGQSSDATRKNNYHRAEVGHEPISGLEPTYHSQIKQPHEYYTNHQEVEPAYSLQYAQRPHTQETGDLVENYRHDAHFGVHRLSEDGTDIAYDIENVSILDRVYQEHRSKRIRRSDVEIDTSPFIVPNNETSSETTSTSESPLNYSANASNADALILKVSGLPPVNRNKISTFLTTPKFPIGEAIDYDYVEAKPINRLKYTYESAYEDDGDFYDDDDSDDDYQNAPSLLSVNAPTYAPTAGYNFNPDLDGSPSERYRKFKRYRHPSTNYGVPGNSYEYPPNSYGAPLNSYGAPTNSYGTPISSYGAPSNSYGTPPHAEPVYLLSESQLQRLVGHHNLNIEHLDVYHLDKGRKQRHPYRGFRKRYPHRSTKFRKLHKNLHKLHKLI
ncbi:Postacrosomal sheath WW domain-binding protein [Eumeta japonica]|uniref:Postacrosomal sheath WW domain-binding protein n=1 Tax=Eumeta variegata TaxID=151549 RepID=A0A4C1WYB5_EUMVA|nr:Postacrosomal sheath WW domain-binding protein [Eumeta japonica]